MTLQAPVALLFDWHGTLVDTVDAMYQAIDDLFPRLAARGLLERLLDPPAGRSEQDARLVNYVRENYELHPKVKAARKLSRTDIFEVLFGSDAEAKEEAHALYDECYRAHFGDVNPFEPGMGDSLRWLKAQGLSLGIVTNRNREFLTHELARVDNGSWINLFDTLVCGDDLPKRKPAPDSILAAIERLQCHNTPQRCWNVGDSRTDIVAARRAGVAGVFYNGAHWEPGWLKKIFPSTPEFPEEPDAIVENFGELERLVQAQS